MSSDSEQPAPEPAASVTVTDPKSMRALAHPLRLTLLGLLRSDGPAPVGRLADAVDEAPGTVSYHLGTLAKWGYVVEAPELASDGRERWWRAAHDTTHFEPLELRDDPARLAASVAMRQMFLQHNLSEQLQALEAEATLESEWLAASSSGDFLAHLTLEEFAEMTGEFDALVTKWWDRGRTTREGTRVVRYLYNAFPRP
ncbi:winged helix-turn-helix domain-containing protein [Leifsonia sp. YIM 134122]|uniref:Winged helix-turn-helix domain-containing protein n=1 Tax=Leifsonia stereocauli TaxID=3134136 RepID=A0ABU9W6G1_9MICO